MNKKSNRRQFLKKTALTSSGVGSVFGLFETTAAEVSGHVIRSNFCVVGAGYAGLSAAYRLERAGHSVTVLEARSRVGGRIWSERFSDGTPLDLGGAWVTASQPGIMRLIDEFGIRTYEQYQRGKTVFLRPDGQLFYVNGPTDLLEALGPDPLLDLAGAQEKIHALAAAIDPTAPWEEVELPLLGPGKTTRDADMMTTMTWLDQNVTNDTAKALLTALLSNIFGLHPGAVSMLHLITQIATTPNRALQDLTGTGPGEAENRRVVGGAGGAAKAIAQHLGNAVILRAPVTEIRQTSDFVFVTSDRVTVRARKVIVAIPTALINQIRFDPPLPQNRAQLQQRFPGGAVWKFWLVYDEAFWRQPQPDLPEGLTGESLAPGSMATVTLDAGRGEGRPTPGLLNTFVTGDAARRIASMTRAARRELIVGEIVKRFGAQAAQLSRNIVYPPTGEPFVEKNWGQDPWTRGGYAGVPGPGVLAGEGFGPALRAPVGRIHWAGVDTATRWYASMDGAVQSGERAAAEVLGASPESME